MREPFAATHRVPASGLRAWSEPDPKRSPVATLDPGLEVRCVEQRADGWARVVCSNTWSAWVDGRGLVAADESRALVVPAGGLASIAGQFASSQARWRGVPSACHSWILVTNVMRCTMFSILPPSASKRSLIVFQQDSDWSPIVAPCPVTPERKANRPSATTPLANPMVCPSTTNGYP